MSKPIGLAFIARKSSLESVRKARARGKQDAKGRGAALCDLAMSPSGIQFLPFRAAVTNLCVVKSDIPHRQ